MRKLIIMLVVVTLTASACASRGPGGLDPVGAETTAPTTTTIVPDTTTSTSTTSTTQPAPATTPTTTTTVPENCTFEWNGELTGTGVLRTNWTDSGWDDRYEPVLIALRYVTYERVLNVASGDEDLVLVLSHDGNELSEPAEIRLMSISFDREQVRAVLMPGLTHYDDPSLSLEEASASWPGTENFNNGLTAEETVAILKPGCVYPLLLFLDGDYLIPTNLPPNLREETLARLEPLMKAYEHNEAVVAYLNGNADASVLDEPGGVTDIDIPGGSAYEQSG